VYVRIFRHIVSLGLHQVERTAALQDNVIRLATVICLFSRVSVKWFRKFDPRK